jgi:hypothetical protein
MERATLLGLLPTTPQPFSLCAQCFLLYQGRRALCARCGESCQTVASPEQLAAAEKALTLWEGA